MRSTLHHKLERLYTIIYVHRTFHIKNELHLMENARKKFFHKLLFLLKTVSILNIVYSTVFQRMKMHSMFFNIKRLIFFPSFLFFVCLSKQHTIFYKVQQKGHSLKNKTKIAAWRPRAKHSFTYVLLSDLLQNIL